MTMTEQVQGAAVPAAPCTTFKDVEAPVRGRPEARVSLRRLALWCGRRSIGLVAAAVLVVAGMAFSLSWVPLVHHKAGWLTPGDLWGIFRGAHEIGWGGFGDLYTVNTGFLAFPAMTLLLAPVAMLSSALHLSESFPFALPHPTAWLILGPVDMVAGSVALVAIDGLATYFDLSARRRLALAGAGVVALWPLVVMWGHAEDALATAFALWALQRALEGRVTAAGWLFGVGMAFQPLVVLSLPVVVLVVVPTWRKRCQFGVRAIVPSLLAVAIPLVHAPRATLTAIVDQPTYPSVDHPTPWLFMSPVMTRARWVTVSRARFNASTHRFYVVHTRELSGLTVAAGPGRLIALALACVLAVFLWRRGPAPPEVVVWAIGVSLALRCVFEGVMTPYYVWPGLAVLLLVASRVGWWRFLGAALTTGLLSWFAEGHHAPWIWYGPTVAMLFLVATLAVPTRWALEEVPDVPTAATAPILERVRLGGRTAAVGGTG